MAFFVAFYSYKGGVGRSLALANVACSLAARGKRVILIDMDLEAPALHDIPEFRLQGRSAEKKGVIEYAAAYSQTGRCPKIGGFVHAVAESPRSGQLWLMPCGQLGEGYQQALGSLSWRRLHARKGTQPFIDVLRAALVEKLNPHYVLIDARTGLSDIGGLSTHLLADMVVAVFNLTRGCIEGTVRAYRSFTSEGTRVRAVQLVASPVPPFPPDGQSLIQSRLEQAAQHMPLGAAYGRRIIRVDYDPAMVLAEELAVRRPEVFRAAECYEALREAIQRANPQDVFSVVETVRGWRSAGRLDKGIKLLSQFAEEHSRDPEGYLELGNLYLESGRAKEAVDAFRKACEVAPALAFAHRRLGEALGATERIEEASAALERAGALGETGPELLAAAGFAAWRLANSKQGAEKRHLLEVACEKYESVFRLKPDDHDTLNNWGNAIGELGELDRADTPEGRQRAQKRWEEALELYERASRISPHSGAYNAACALTMLGRFGEAALRLAVELLRRPGIRSDTLKDPDFKNLWLSYPTLRQAIEDCAATKTDTPLEQWLAEHRSS